MVQKNQIKKGQESNCTIFETNYGSIIDVRPQSITTTRQSYQYWGSINGKSSKLKNSTESDKGGVVPNVKKGQESNCTIFETNYEKVIGVPTNCTTTRQGYQHWGAGGANSRDENISSKSGKDGVVPNVKKGQESNCTIFETNYEEVIGIPTNCTTTRQGYQHWGVGGANFRDQKASTKSSKKEVVPNVKKGQESNCTIFETNYEKVVGIPTNPTTTRQGYQDWGTFRKFPSNSSA